MKHWVERKAEYGYGEKSIVIREGNERILSVSKDEKGITFMEECDAWFSHIYTNEEALELIEELKDWINQD